jgi:NAD(P)-dependent dehydrogenase (short-subunit alcohol dehydrogenase family)
MTGKLDRKVAVVTGGAQGIGEASALLMAREGAAIVIADILEPKARSVVEKIIAAGGRASQLTLNVTRESDWVQAIAEVKATYGALHILMNNAGIGRSVPLVEMAYETFREVFALNLDGMFLGMKHAIPLIAASGGGSIINMSSAAAMKVYANMSAYCASKAGVAQLTKVAALECAQMKTNIRVNSLHPGMVATPAWNHLGNSKDGAPPTLLDLDAMAEATVPLGYVADADEIAKAVLFLASEDSRYITGTELVVDGGLLLP